MRSAFIAETPENRGTVHPDTYDRILCAATTDPEMARRTKGITISEAVDKDATKLTTSHAVPPCRRDAFRPAPFVIPAP